MAAPVVVNGDVSLVLVDTAALTANQAAVVLLSSVQTPGRTVTIRDSVGSLSSPQTIIVSTQAGVRFSDGTSSVTLTQPFSYLTVTSRDAASWNFKNSFAFAQNELIANAASLSVNALTTSTLYSPSFISSAALTTGTLTATSTSAVAGALYASTLVIAPPNPAYRPFESDPGYTTYIQGNLKTYQSLVVDGGASFTGTISTGGNFTITGNISSLGSFGVRGDIMTTGNVYAQGGGGFFRSLDLLSSATIAGPATFSNVLSVTSTLAVGASVSTAAVTASTVRVAADLQFGGGKSIVARSTDILFSDPLTVPALSTMNLYASNAITTSTLTVLGSLNAASASSFTLGSAAIENPNGSLLISSITGNVATFSTLSTGSLTTSSLTASSLFLTGAIQVPVAASFTIGALTVSSLSTGFLGAGSTQALSLQTSSLSTNYLTVTGAFTADSLTTFSAAGASLTNDGGSITTSSLTTASLLTASTVLFSTLFSPTSSLLVTAPMTYIPSATISTVYASSFATSTLTTTRITIGAPASNYAYGPTFSVNTDLYPSTSVVIAGGPGDSLTPYTVSNVKPDFIEPGDPYAVEVAFRLDWNGPAFPGYFADVPNLTLFPNGEAGSQLTLRTINDSNTIVNLYGIYGSNQTYQTDPSTGGISIPLNVTPSSFFHLTGVMVGFSAFSFTFQSRSNVNATRIDSNATVTVENGVLQWPYSLNGTTIQNSLNDMSVRTLYYYGSLNFASDPALKDVLDEPVDHDRCSEIVASVPLVRYRYKDAYESLFKPLDRHRIGVLATDLERLFPRSIVRTELAGYAEPVRMIDTQQLEFAHLGATQALQRRVAALTSTLESLQKNLPTS